MLGDDDDDESSNDENEVQGGFSIPPKEMAKLFIMLLKEDSSESDQTAGSLMLLPGIDRMAKDQHYARRLADKLVSSGFAEKYRHKLKKHMTELQSCNDEMQHFSQTCPFFMFTVMFSSLVSLACGVSDEFCATIVANKVHIDLLDCLLMDVFNPKRVHVNETVWQQIVILYIGVLFSMVRKSDEAIADLRGSRAVDVLQPFAECKYNTLSPTALVVQAYLVTEEENYKICSNADMFQLLVSTLRLLVHEGTIQDVMGYASQTLPYIEAINKLAVNDSNKKKLVEVGALPYYVRLLQPDRPDVEQEAAAHGLWIIAFRCKQSIKNEPGCIDGKRLISAGYIPY